MASIHIREIQNMLAKQGKKDALPYQDCSEGYFFEICFDKPGVRSGSVDEEFKNKVISVDCPYGSVLIIFDEEGLLKSIELS